MPRSTSLIIAAWYTKLIAKILPNLYENKSKVEDLEYANYTNTYKHYPAA